MNSCSCACRQEIGDGGHYRQQGFLFRRLLQLLFGDAVQRPGDDEPGDIHRQRKMGRLHRSWQGLGANPAMAPWAPVAGGRSGQYCAAAEALSAQVSKQIAKL